MWRPLSAWRAPSADRRLPTLCRDIADKWIRQYNLKGCQGDLASGFKSLQRAAPPGVSGELSALAGAVLLDRHQERCNHTSKALLQTWQLLKPYSHMQDGQLLRDDAIVPDSKFLGMALADHFAVALPFDKSSDSAIRSAWIRPGIPERRCWKQSTGSSPPTWTITQPRRLSLCNDHDVPGPESQRLATSG